MEREFITTLPPNVARVLIGFVEDVRRAFGPDLSAVVLYGSGAEGKLRATSDVNVLLLDFPPIEALLHQLDRARQALAQWRARLIAIAEEEEAA